MTQLKKNLSKFYETNCDTFIYFLNKQIKRLCLQTGF